MAKFHVNDEQKHQDFFTPHALLHDKDREIFWAALLRPNGVAVYLALLNHAGYRSRECYPSESTLAKETGLSLPQVKREIKKLKEFHFITVTTRAEKQDLFDLPKREKNTNTYTLLDKDAWRVPDNYHDDYAPKKREDIGKQHQWKQPKTSGQLNLMTTPNSISQIPESIAQKPEIVSERYQGGISQIPERYLRDTQNNTNEITPGNNPNNNNNTTTDDVDVVVAINTLLSQTTRTERISADFVQMLCALHNVQSATEVLKAAQILAPNPAIKSVLAVLKGRRNGSERYDSSCFYGGVCLLAATEPEETPDRATKEHERPFRAAAELQAQYRALSARELDRFRTAAEKALRQYKRQMKPEIYAETLQHAMFQEFAKSLA